MGHWPSAGACSSALLGRSPDGGAPLELRQAQRRARGEVDSEVEQEAAHGGDDDEGRHGEALQVEGRHAVHGSKQQAGGVQAADELPEVEACAQQRSSRAQGLLR